MSADGNQEYSDDVEELASRLSANDESVLNVCLEFEKWEELTPRSNEDHKSEVDADVCKLFNALEDNNVVRQVEIGCGWSFTSVGVVAAKAIARGLYRNRSVKDIVIYCESFYGQIPMEIVLEGLVGTNNITKLTIVGHDGCDEPPAAALDQRLSRTLAEILRQSSSIEELTLVDESIGWEKGLDPICDGLRKNKSIKTLDLVDGHFLSDLSCGATNSLDPEVCSKLCDAVGDKAMVRLKTHVCQGLNSLISNHNNISELRADFLRKVDYCEWQDLAKALSRNDSIETFTFFNEDRSNQKPEMIDWRSRSLLEAIASTSIENLVFKGFPMDDDGVDIVCRALRKSTSIRNLRPNNCGNRNLGPSREEEARITAQSAISIAKPLKSTNSLESVQLDSLGRAQQYDIGDEGALALVSAVAKRKVKTKRLRLLNCNIGDQGGIAFCRLLKQSSSGLEELELLGNDFGPSALKKFADSLSDNSTLRSLKLTTKSITSSQKVDTVIRFIKALKTNHCLQTLHIFWTCNDNESEKEKDRVAAALQDMLQTNHTVSGYFPGFSDLQELLFSTNHHHPILVSTEKSAPFPSHLIEHMPACLIPNAIERADNIAGVDGVFSLLRRVGDGIWDGIDPTEPTKETKKRRRN